MRLLAILTACLVFELAGCAAADPPAARQSAADLKIASVELAGGSPATALQVTQSILAGNPRDTAALVLTGDAQSALGQRDLADGSYHQALAIRPGLLDASLGLARLDLVNDPAHAGATLRELLRHHPQDARIWTDLGVAYDLQSTPRAAQDAYRHAITRDRSLISAQVDLGLSLALSGAPGEGISLLAPLAAGPHATPRLRADLAVAEAMAGDDPAARQILGQDLPTEQVSATLVGLRSLAQ